MNKMIWKNIKMLLKIFLIIISVSACSFGEGGEKTNYTVGKVRLNIETYQAGLNQPTHPSIITFDNEWNGYRYWMAYTPYPGANGEEENPSIAASNDMYKWETPYGMVNPIANNEETGCHELKDSHILFRSDLNRIEVWYLGRLSKNLGGDGNSLTLFRKYSYDGIIWSSYEVMDNVSYLSPTVRWDGNKYQMWSIGFDTYETTGTFVYQESTDGKNWTFPKKCSIGNKTENLEIWHGSVNYDTDTDTYFCVYIPNAEDSQTIELCESKDGIHFTKNQSIVQNDSTTLWQRFYRPCLLVDEGTYHLFYGVITEDNKWFISYSKGKTLEKMVGINEEDSKKMVTLNDTVINTKSISYISRMLYHSLSDHLRPELGIMVVFLLLVNIFYQGKQLRKLEYYQFFVVIAICIGYTIFLFKDKSFYGIYGSITAGILEGICIYCVVVVIEKILRKRHE